jgi:hypothetical protein
MPATKSQDNVCPANDSELAKLNDRTGSFIIIYIFN